MPSTGNGERAVIGRRRGRGREHAIDSARGAGIQSCPEVPPPAPVAGENPAPAVVYVRPVTATLPVLSTVTERAGPNPLDFGTWRL